MSIARTRKSPTAAPTPGSERDRELARLAAGGDREARHALALRHQGLVRLVARRYAGRGVDRDDLDSWGQVGLMTAVDRYRPDDFGNRFATYAVHWIRQSIRRGLQGTARTIRVPVYAAEYAAAIRRGGALGRSARAIAARAQPETVAAILGAPRVGPVGEHAARLADGKSPGPAEAAEAEDELRAMRRAMDAIPARLAAVLRLRHGIDDGRPRTHREVGEQFGFTRERSRQMEAEAVRAVRARMGLDERTGRAAG